MNAVRISSVGPFVRNDMLASMGSLFVELARQASANARRKVETYTREIPEFGFLDNDPRARVETLEHATWLRHRSVELSPHNGELTDDDLGYIATVGELTGIDPGSTRGVRTLSAVVTRRLSGAWR